MPVFTAIGQWLLTFLWPIVWHALKRFGSVIAVGLFVVILLMKFHAFKLNLYNEGYKAGYNQALKDHPTYTVGSGGTVVNNYKVHGIGFHLGKGVLGYAW